MTVMTAHSRTEITPRGLSRIEAARYVGVSPTTFDKLVVGKKMPNPKHVGTRRIWDRHLLDMAFDEISGDDESPNPWDDAP
jgi:hypothetical protein